MNWQEILTLGVPLFAFLAWVYTRLDKRFEIVDKKFDCVLMELKSIREDLHKIDNRLTRLEGRFDERLYWEAKEYHKRTGTEDKN